jgi:hypothetical protein
MSLRPTFRIEGRAMRRPFLLLLVLSLGACRTLAPAVPRYIVTLTPVSLGGGDPGRHPGLCIAVDPVDAQGVWWWQPGPSGCSSRITGPTVFRAHLATVTTATDSGATEVGFQVPVMEGPPREFKLVLHDASMRVVASGERVSTERRSAIDIPFAFGR